MPARAMPFVSGEYYHLFNRGVAKMPIFTSGRDYQRFRQTLLYYLDPAHLSKFSAASKDEVLLRSPDPIVELIAYCLMPNHFHLLLKQTSNISISTYMQKVGNSYTKYFNIKYKRVGPLFQGQFKAIRIETNEQLIHVSRYIHLNPIIGYVSKSLKNYLWSSYVEYTNTSAFSFCSKLVILSQFTKKDAYKRFVEDQIDYAKSLDTIKHQLIDLEI